MKVVLSVLALLVCFICMAEAAEYVPQGFPSDRTDLRPQQRTLPDRTARDACPSPAPYAPNTSQRTSGDLNRSNRDADCIPDDTHGHVQAALTRLPLHFIANQGQADSRVAYYLQGARTTVYFTAQGLTFALTGPRDADAAQPTTIRPVAFDRTERPPAQRWTVKLDFIGANPDVRPIGEDQTPAVVSYFKGAPADWKTGLPTYTPLRYRDLWPGIDLVYSGTGGRLKSTFLVQPGADPSQIKVAYRGATTVALASDGHLEVTTPVGSFQEAAPIAWQDVGGEQVPVTAAFTLAATDDGGVYTAGFRLGAYDTTSPLVVDPVVLMYAGYIGGQARTGALPSPWTARGTPT